MFENGYGVVTLGAMDIISMKQRGIYLGVVLILSFITPSCKKEKDCPDGSHEDLTIVNNSAVQVNWASEYDPKNSVWQNNGSTEYPSIAKRIMEPGDIRKIGPELGQCWEYMFAGNVKQYFFFFSHDTVKAIGWEKIKGTNRGLLKRVQVDLNYLQQHNFTLTYP